MFYDANSFDQPLDSWNISNITKINYMFYGSTSFNQSLEKWSISKVINVEDMFNSLFDKIPSWFRK